MEARSGFDDDGTMEDAMAEQDELESRLWNAQSAIRYQDNYRSPAALQTPTRRQHKQHSGRPYREDLVAHEANCLERTIHCPAPNGCDEVVQLKNFHQHAVRNQCSVAIRRPTKFNLSKGWLRWDGTSLRKNEEFNLREDLAWSFFHTVQFDNNFYFSAQYFAAEQLFLFYVMVMGGVDLAEQFTAHIALTSKENRVRLMFSGPLLPLDRVPATEEALMASTSCFTVHYRAMRPLLSVTEVGENRNVCWSVDFLAEVDLVRKTEEGLSPMIQ